jgi:hypothetical protein
LLACCDVGRGGLMLLDSLSFICIVVVRQPFDPFHPCRSAAFPSFVSLSLGSLLTRFVLVPGPSAAFRSVVSLSFGSFSVCVVDFTC